MTESNYPWFPAIDAIAKPNRCFIITKAKSYAMQRFSQLVAQHYLQTNELTDHLDYLVIDKKDKASISIDTVRLVVEKTHLTSRSTLGKVLIVDDADKLTNSASNAMLKVLEEPPTQLLTMLLCENQESLQSTLRSRCETIMPLQLPNESMLQWLIDRGHERDLAQLSMLLNYHKPISALETLEQNALDDFYVKAANLFDVLTNELSIANHAKKFVHNRDALLAELELLLVVLVGALRFQNTHTHTFEKYEMMDKLIRFFAVIPAYLLSDLMQWVCKLNAQLHTITGLRSDWAVIQLQLKIQKIALSSKQHSSNIQAN